MWNEGQLGGKGKFRTPLPHEEGRNATPTAKGVSRLRERLVKGFGENLLRTG